MVHLALTVAALVAVVIAVASGSRRLDLPAPLVLVAFGIGASFVPFVPEIRLTADLVLLGFLPPLLYSAALKTSLVDFNANRRPILLLSIGLTAFTAVGVAVVVHAVVPDLPWVAAFALGAVVAPPDAVAATTIARRVGMPRRIVRILEGESLLNDATALVALRTALGATAGTVSVLAIGLDFLVAAAGGMLVGLLFYVTVGWVRRHVTDSLVDTGVSLVTPFAAYATAETIHASGVLAVVIAGLMLGHRAPVLQTASSRIAERLNWRTIAFLLENTVFLLIGLQTRTIVGDVAESDLTLGVVAVACLATLGAVISLRLAWVFAARYVLDRPGPDHQTGEHPSWAHTLVVGWAGMRGVVTLAAAFVIPRDVAQRDLLVLVALFVTAATLFLQGLTLPWLVRRLRLPGPDAREDALARASLFQQASVAGRDWLELNTGADDAHGTGEALRRRLEIRDFAAWERVGNSDPEAETPSEAYARLRRAMIGAERERVLEVRDSGRVPHEVIEDVLAALDVEESMLEDHTERHETLRRTVGGVVTGTHGTVELCAHLAEATGDPTPTTTDGCEDCLALGEHAWVHLRLCLTCGHVGCCDSSPHRHATAHFHESAHPVVRSAEPGEHWRWCFVDDRLG